MAERDLYPAILLELTRDPSVRLFRANSGIAWQGEVISQTVDRLILSRPRAVRLGPEGMSDLIGWSKGRFVAIECKNGRNKLTEPQAAFIRAVQNSGGLAGVAYSVEDARRIVVP